MTKFTVTIAIDLITLKKLYARYFGEKNWRKVKKSDIAGWVADLAKADIESDLDKLEDE